MRRLCAALDLTGKALDRLGPKGYTDPAEPANSVRPEKVLSEAAFLLLAASSIDRSSDVSRRVSELCDQLIPLARSNRFLAGICVQPTLALDYGLAHLCLNRIGLPDTRFDAALHIALDAHPPPTRELPPHRALEQLWLLRGLNGARAGLAPTPRQLSGIVSRTNLTRTMDVLNGSRDDTYAFTHSLMYATDFNIDPRRLPRPRRSLLADAEACLARAIDEQDYDLAGELLLSWPLTGASWDPAAVFAFGLLADIEDRAGLLPSPSTKGERLNQLQGQERTDYLLATGYHTAFVMGLLCAAALQPGRQPPIGLPNDRRRAPHAAQLINQLAADPPQRHWQDFIARFPEAEIGSLANLLLTIVLRRAVVDTDFPRVRDLLQLALRANLAGNPGARQAGRLLQRLGAAFGDAPQDV